MPKCRNCGKNISKFDNDICPYCGEEYPIEEDYKTMDITQTFDTLGGEPLYKSKRQLTWGLLCIFLGYFGAHDFYIGKVVRGLIELFSTLILVAGIGCALFFTFLDNAAAFILPFLLIWLVYLCVGIHLLGLEGAKDGQGVLLR